MTVNEIWPDLQQAWVSTGDDTLGAPGEASGHCWRVLKSESRARVLMLHAEAGEATVLKIYRTPPHLLWRTLGRASRANREFTLMMNAHRNGLQVVRPFYWLERRVSGCVAFSAIALSAVTGPDLESWLLDRPDSASKRRSAEAVGRLLADFHRAGLFLCTSNPRNLLLPEGNVDEMLAIDMPYARLHNRDIRGAHHALTDLAQGLLLSDGRPAFEGGERTALITAYCHGDTKCAKDLDGRVKLLSHRQWKRRRMLRRINNLFSKGVKSAGRGGVYDVQSGMYHPLQSEAVFIPQDAD